MTNVRLPRRLFGVGRLLASAAVFGSLLGGSALAQQSPPETSSRESQGRCDRRPSAERDLLRYSLSYVFPGIPVPSLSKDGKEIGPQLLTILPDDALDGSTEGRRHLRHARLFHWATLTSGLMAVGLLSAAAVVRFNEKRWTSPAEHLAAAGGAVLFLGVLLSYDRQEELMAAIDAYNDDVLRRR